MAMITALRDRFAALFGEEQAKAFEKAGQYHASEMGKGTVTFQGALVFCIGSECFTKPAYRQHHGITADVVAVQHWIRNYADLENYQGEMDFLAALCGMYDWYMGKAVVQPFLAEIATSATKDSVN